MTPEASEEERGRDLVRRASADVRAPLRLREAVEPLRMQTRGRRRRTRALAAAAAAVVATGTAVGLALTLPGEVPGRPDVVQAAALAQRPATRPAPPRDPADPRFLAARVDSVAFPDWGTIRWPATGTRTDRLRDRSVTTVYYARGGQVVGYQIVSGDPLPPPVATRQELIGDTVYRSFRAGGRTIVTWVRDGRTCVVSARGMPAWALRRLAAWEA
jgi:hypothetical protein